MNPGKFQFIHLGKSVRRKYCLPIGPINEVPFQKFQTWYLQDRKLIFYVKGKDELMEVEIIKERDKDFMCLIKVKICDKKLVFTKQFNTVPDVTCKKAAI